MGEPSGVVPLVRVAKEIKENNNNNWEVVAELKGHRYGVKLLAVVG